MILAGGERFDTGGQGRILDGLAARLDKTLSGPPLRAETVVAACDALGKKIAAGDYAAVIAGLGLENAQAQAEAAARLLSRESLEARLETELGMGWEEPEVLHPPFAGGELTKRKLPLGVLFHIAAGNVDGLPAYSVAEGLLTGNINILKLPQADNGLSITLLEELIRLAPELREFIYVFDTPSEDVASMRRMADLADGIVTWGGDAAVAAVRSLAKPGTRLIEWGHKLGFCYLVPGTEREEDLNALAEHILETKQLLCSSCQVIYLDTERMDTVHAFCRAFLPYLERAAEKFPNRDIGAVAELSLRRYTARLEQLAGGEEEPGLYPGKGCSLQAREDSALELSPMFGNCLVKRLPRGELLPVLRRSKEYLQTAGLVCRAEEWEALSELLFRCGVVKTAAPGEMSRPTCCDGHDGEAPLRRYLRIADSIAPKL